MARKKRNKNGEGTINWAGYHATGSAGSTFKFTHIAVWEEHNGPVPEGMIVHHINEDRLDNRIENLQMLSRRDHNRVHRGWKLVDGEWWKPCPSCKQVLPLTEFPLRGTHSGRRYSWCPECHKRDPSEQARNRKV